MKIEKCKDIFQRFNIWQQWLYMPVTAMQSSAAASRAQ